MWMPPLYREFTSHAQIDAQYGTQSIPDPAGEARHYSERSRLARKSLRCLLDVPFGPTLDETLDIFPAELPKAPVFVFIHGGYWRANTSRNSVAWRWDCSRLESRLWWSITRCAPR